jgi:RNA polymerase sigma factor (sigma-70 family)
VNHGEKPNAAASPLAADIGDVFQTHERALWGLCYRLTGSAADADDLVQETFVRAMERPPARTDEPWRPWLVRVATNLGLDLLRRRRRRGYVGRWLPSPVETGEDAAPAPEEPAGGRCLVEGRYEMLESVSFAFLLALEALTPRQRAVLLLRDVFDYSARETAAVLGVSEANVRIILHRARRAMEAYDRERCVPTGAVQATTRRVLEAFLTCLVNQDVAGIEALLTTDARTITDGGAEFTALRVPIVGREKVATFHLRTARRRAPGARVDLRMINGLPAIVAELPVARPGQAPRVVLRCDVGGDGRIRELHLILASRKLTAVRFGSPPL